jgi:hypothetical protein
LHLIYILTKGINMQHIMKFRKSLSLYMILCIYFIIIISCTSTSPSTQDNFSGTYIASGGSGNRMTFIDNEVFFDRRARYTFYSGTFVVDGNNLTFVFTDGTKFNWQIIDNSRVRDEGGVSWYRASKKEHNNALQRKYEIEQRLKQEAEQQQQAHEAMLRQRGITEEQWQAEQAERRRVEAEAKREQEALSQLIQNLLDVGVNVGRSFRIGDIVAIPLGLFRIIDVSTIGDIFSYLVIMNDHSTPTIPFYIETSRQLSSGIGPMRIEYIGTAQFMHGRSTRNTLRFREIR